MRPRVFPAEDRLRIHVPASPHVASMRPRVFPAEDGDGAREQLRAGGRASMRPRVFPAEDLDSLLGGLTFDPLLQ